jgi:hypothetical protein
MTKPEQSLELRFHCATLPWNVAEYLAITSSQDTCVIAVLGIRKALCWVTAGLED